MVDSGLAFLSETKEIFYKLVLCDVLETKNKNMHTKIMISKTPGVLLLLFTSIPSIPAQAKGYIR